MTIDEALNTSGIGGDNNNGGEYFDKDEYIDRINEIFSDFDKTIEAMNIQRIEEVTQVQKIGYDVTAELYKMIGGFEKRFNEEYNRGWHDRDKQRDLEQKHD